MLDGKSVIKMERVATKNQASASHIYLSNIGAFLIDLNEKHLEKA